jgi:hypothetical protein
MADNRHSTTLLECVKCGLRYQAVAPTIRWCLCGGELRPLEKKEMPK